MPTNSRKQCTAGDRCKPRDEREALYCLLHHSEQSLQEIAAFLGKRPGYLMDAGNPDREDLHFQAELVSRVTRFTNNPVYIDAIAHNAGGVFVPTPRVSADFGEANVHTATVLREVADVLQSLASIFADRRVTDEELADGERQIDEAATALFAVREFLRDVHAKQKEGRR